MSPRLWYLFLFLTTQNSRLHLRIIRTYILGDEMENLSIKSGEEYGHNIMQAISGNGLHYRDSGMQWLLVLL